MGSQSSSFEDLAGAAMREFALGRSAAIGKYGNLLTRFGKGEVEAQAFGENLVQLALEEGARYTQDAIKLGTAYLGFISKLAPTASAAPQAKRARTKRGPSTPFKRKSRTKRAASASKQGARTKRAASPSERKAHKRKRVRSSA